MWGKAGPKDLNKMGEYKMKKLGSEPDSIKGYFLRKRYWNRHNYGEFFSFEVWLDARKSSTSRGLAEWVIANQHD